MLIFISIVILVIISFIMIEFGIGCDILQDLIWPLFVIIGIAALILMSVAFGINYCVSDAEFVGLQERYASLTYQLDNQMYNNDNEFGKIQLVDQITEWNEELAYNRALKHNLWTNWFIAVDYDSLEYIPMNNVK